MRLIRLLLGLLVVVLLVNLVLGYYVNINSVTIEELNNYYLFNINYTNTNKLSYTLFFNLYTYNYSVEKKDDVILEEGNNLLEVNISKVFIINNSYNLFLFFKNDFNSLNDYTYFYNDSLCLEGFNYIKNYLYFNKSNFYLYVNSNNIYFDNLYLEYYLNNEKITEKINNKTDDIYLLEKNLSNFTYFYLENLNFQYKNYNLNYFINKTIRDLELEIDNINLKNTSEKLLVNISFNKNFDNNFVTNFLTINNNVYSGNIKINNINYNISLIDFCNENSINVSELFISINKLSKFFHINKYLFFNKTKYCNFPDLVFINWSYFNNTLLFNVKNNGSSDIIYTNIIITDTYLNIIKKYDIFSFEKNSTKKYTFYNQNNLTNFYIFLDNNNLVKEIKECNNYFSLEEGIVDICYSNEYENNNLKNLDSIRKHSLINNRKNNDDVNSKINDQFNNFSLNYIKSKIDKNLSNNKKLRLLLFFNEKNKNNVSLFEEYYKFNISIPLIYSILFKNDLKVDLFIKDKNQLLVNEFYSLKVNQDLNKVVFIKKNYFPIIKYSTFFRYL